MFEIKMNKYLKSVAARAKIGLATSRELVEAATTALVQGSKSKSLTLLAGEISDAAYYCDLEKLYFEGLNEEGILIPSASDAKLLLLIETLENITNDKISPESGMSFIHNNLDGLDLFPEKNNYVGEHLGLERCYTWYRELQDYADGPGEILFYHTDLPRDEAASKFREHLREEAGNALRKIKQEFEQTN